MDLHPLSSADESETAMPRTDEEWRSYVAQQIRHQQHQLNDGALRMKSIEDRLSGMEDDLKANTESTKRVETNTAGLVSAWTSVQSGFKVIGWLGSAIEWIGKKFLFLSVFAAACFGLWKALIELAKDKLS